MSELRTAPSGTDLAPRLRLAVMRLARRLRQQADGPLTPSQTSAMHSIERLESVTLGDLAAAERVQPPSMTRIVASLEEAAYVAREVDPGDRRIARVRLTAEGRRLLERGRTRKTAYLATRLRDLEAGDAEALERAIAIIEGLNEGER